jgi:hypothetical protein
MYALGMYLRAEKDAGIDGSSGADRDAKGDENKAEPAGSAGSAGGGGGGGAGQAARVDEEFALVKLALGRLNDGAPVVRRELVLLLAAVRPRPPLPVHPPPPLPFPVLTGHASSLPPY